MRFTATVHTNFCTQAQSCGAAQHVCSAPARVYNRATRSHCRLLTIVVCRLVQLEGDDHLGYAELIDISLQFEFEFANLRVRLAF